MIIIIKREPADFAIPADHRERIIETQNRDKILDFAWELKKLWRWYQL